MAAPDLQMIPPAALSAQAVLEIAFPVLPPHAALCIGVTLAPALFAAIPDCCYEYTSVSEQARAGRFLHTGDALRHLYGRALLRQAALAYGVMRGIQEFDLNPWGKPVFPGASLQGNISHSGMQVWLALARDCEIGIDIESAQAPADFADIAASFHPQERQSIREASDPPQAMMRCWSRKEAVAKAVGRGLSLPLDSYAVDCGIGATDWLRQAPPGTALPNWRCADLPPTPDHVGAVSAHGDCREIRMWQLNIVAGSA
ncbi:4'-phosphopantetheinyl transferase family protein [Herbaspirillum rhizosphaerae]|uniref:4'-phosphopantetheinyl transferase family protein n=1 Tax=Herbaspirillum rhizosphaerae TaxID=346179 RepID=UPI00067DEACD|nr:4'-phosphopantetheinyl transferase superfamily protein [Herbaspirillum rhizosphaerae]